MSRTFFDTFDAAERLPKDPCRRAGANPESAAAFERITPHLPAAREAVLAEIRKAGDYGATSHEISKALGKGMNEISGRITELVECGLVYRDRVRNGAAVCFCRDV